MSSKKSELKKSEKLTFIKGTFSSADAEEILVNVFSAKIHFHEMKNFSSEIRYGRVDETAKKRVPELRKELEKVSQIISEAKLQKKNLLIKSEIIIILEDQ